MKKAININCKDAASDELLFIIKNNERINEVILPREGDVSVEIDVEPCDDVRLEFNRFDTDLDDETEMKNYTIQNCVYLLFAILLSFLPTAIYFMFRYKAIAYKGSAKYRLNVRDYDVFDLEFVDPTPSCQIMTLKSEVPNTIEYIFEDLIEKNSFKRYILCYFCIALAYLALAGIAYLLGSFLVFHRLRWVTYIILVLVLLSLIRIPIQSYRQYRDIRKNGFKLYEDDTSDNEYDDRVDCESEVNKTIVTCVEDKLIKKTININCENVEFGDIVFIVRNNERIKTVALPGKGEISVEIDVQPHDDVRLEFNRFDEKLDDENDMKSYTIQDLKQSFFAVLFSFVPTKIYFMCRYKSVAYKGSAKYRLNIKDYDVIDMEYVAATSDCPIMTMKSQIPDAIEFVFVDLIEKNSFKRYMICYFCAVLAFLAIAGIVYLLGSFALLHVVRWATYIILLLVLLSLIRIPIPSYRQYRDIQKNGIKL